MSASFDGPTSATNPQFSANTPPFGGRIGGTPDSQPNVYGANASGYGQGGATLTGGAYSSPGYGTTGYTAPPTVSVTDYGSSPYPPRNNAAPDNRGFEEDSVAPTDFDALFSGKSRPGMMVSGMDGTHQHIGKANEVLGRNDPNNLVYENSGFSRNVHFDPNSLQGSDFGEPQEHSKKRRESLTGGSKKSKSLFLNRGRMTKNDRWLEWSEKMRVEAQVKKEEFLRKQEEAAKNKLPTPIRKARQESVKFGNHITTGVEEETPLSKALLAMEQATPSSTSAVLSKEQIRDRYTEDQWEKLHAYWGHQLFRKCRPAGYILAFVAMVSAIPPLLSTRWVKLTFHTDVNFTYTLGGAPHYPNYPQYNCSYVNENGTCYESYEKIHIEHHGFWFNCTDNITTYSGIHDEACKPIDLPPDLKWQSAILGLLLFSLAAGFFASFLTTWGVCAKSLARKVYFYHSAGEIFFVCAICSVAALTTYPAVLESGKNNVDLEYGIGYFLGWGMPFFYVVSALCMTLDDIIHSLTNDCCLCCASKSVNKQPLTTASV
ncbi:uncharacterized protein [Watersipora subatra]|uniref:uncharacterized protein n=1 Tax=Watersipora subatra TaxID=2589382 RepID=UPI00355C2752